MNGILRRLSIFQRQLVALWRAFWHPLTPFYLKAMMVGVVVYLIIPVDLLPDFIAVLGWVDDVLLVTFAVNWIVKRVPAEVFSDPASAHAYSREDFDEDAKGTTINGTARHM